MATKGIGRPLTILLRADTDGFAKGIQTAETKLKSLNKSLNKASVVAGVALGGLAAAGLDFAKAAAQDEKSSRVLEKTLQNVTNATKAQTAAVEDYITQTSLALGIQDDELRPAYARLVRSTEDVAGAQNLLNLALDISAATGKPIEKIADSLGKAYDGNTTALGRLGLGIDATKLKSKDFGVIYDDLAQKFDGFAKSEAATGEGSLRRLSVAVDEAKESIGKGLLPFVSQAADAIARWTPKIAENAETILKVSAAAAIAAAAIVGLKIAVTTASIAVQVATVTASGLRLAYLTLTAATGSARSAQILAELSYKNVTIASRLYTIALGVQTVALKVAELGVKGLTRALLLNPFTAVAVVALAAAVALNEFANKTTKSTRAAGATGRNYGAQATRLNNIAIAANGATTALVKTTAATSNLNQETRDVARAAGRSNNTYVSWRDTLKSYNIEVPKAAKATGGLTKAQKELAKATEKAQKIADKFQTKLDAAKTKLEAAKEAFRNYRDGLADAIRGQFDFAKAFEDKGKGSFIESLRKQAEAAKAFGGKIAQLLKAGLNQKAIDQIVAAGAATGGAMADEILAGGAAAISEVNTLTNSVDQVAKAVGTDGAKAFYQAGITQGEALVAGIIAALKAAGLTVKGGKVTLPTSASAIKSIANNSATANSISSSSSNSGVKSGQSVNITVNGAIDPEGTRRALEKLFQSSARRTGPVSLVGATL